VRHTAYVRHETGFRQRVLEAVVAAGGVLLIVGSQWHLVTDYVVGATAGRNSRIPTMLTSQLTASRSPLWVSEWIPLFLLICGIVISSIAFDAVSARHRRAAVGPPTFVIAFAAAVCLAALGLRLLGASTAVGPGFALSALGALLGVVAASVWSYPSSAHVSRLSLGLESFDGSPQR
jgi:hypothetical protein